MRRTGGKLARVPLDSEDARRMLQERVALYAAANFALGAVLHLTSRWVAAGAGGSVFALQTTWAFTGHLLVVLAVGGIALVTRRGRWSSRPLLALEIAATLLPIAYALLALWFSARDVRPELMVVLLAGYLLILRAVLVPGTGARSTAVGAGVSLALVAWTYLYQRRFATPGLTTPAVYTVMTATWSGMAVIVSAVVSHTLYGLRLKVRQATQLGQYTLLRKIGEGGMGVVYEARHALLRRRTALKLLPVEKAEDRSVARFEREVQLTSGLSHPNTVAIYDYGRSPDGVFYYAMEYIDGLDVQQLVDRHGPQPPALVAHVLAQVAGALAEAHAAGLVHRDVKPANVILCERGGMPGTAKVVDFGLVKHGTPPAQADLTGGDARPVRQPVTIIGTPLYLAPEAVLGGDRAGPPSDVYGLGALGYLMLTGTPPFEGATVVEVCAHHLDTPPVRPSERLGRPLPPALEALVLACLEKDPARRPTARDLALAAGELPVDWRADDAATWWQRCRPSVAVPTATAAAGRLTVDLQGRR